MFSLHTSTSILLAALSIPGVYAWGATGHQAVGYVAMPFLAPKALAFVKSTLGTTASFNQSLGPAATWADEIKSNSSFAWASILHFVDAFDNPPSTCSVNQTRDCADGRCILSAISNYTARVVQTSLSATEQQQALLFLDHFIGDIGQPLHVENFELGGNGVSAKCGGSNTNLHAVWDSGIINRLVSANYSSSSQVWANELVGRIKSGAYTSQIASWISCSSTTAPVSIEEDITAHLTSRTRVLARLQREAGFLDDRQVEGEEGEGEGDDEDSDTEAITPLQCPLVWARDSNKLDCSIVFDYPNFSDLCTSSYYSEAVPVIENQIAKQGYRLAAWLNVLFDGETQLT